MTIDEKRRDNAYRDWFGTALKPGDGYFMWNAIGQMLQADDRYRAQNKPTMTSKQEDDLRRLLSRWLNDAVSTSEVFRFCRDIILTGSEKQEQAMVPDPNSERPYDYSQTRTTARDTPSPHACITGKQKHEWIHFSAPGKSVLDNSASIVSGMVCGNCMSIDNLTINKDVEPKPTWSCGPTPSPDEDGEPVLPKCVMIDEDGDYAFEGGGYIPSYTPASILRALAECMEYRERKAKQAGPEVSDDAMVAAVKATANTSVAGVQVSDLRKVIAAALAAQAGKGTT